MDDVLHVDIDGGVATVWLNRPHVRNALSALLIGGLRETIASLDANDDIGAIVLTGADPAFCAGLDLAEVAAGALGGVIRDVERLGQRAAGDADNRSHATTKRFTSSE